MRVDFGTGDGALVYRTARQRPSELIIGVDANAELMREISRRSLRKPSRGGVPNALFGRLSLEDAPGELIGLAGMLSIVFPWGSLLRAVAAPKVEQLRELAAMVRPGARIFIVYGYDAERDASTLKELGLPALGASAALRQLEIAYAAAGLKVRARYASREQVASIESTWAKKLAFAGSGRVFVALQGTVERAAEAGARRG